MDAFAPKLGDRTAIPSASVVICAPKTFFFLDAERAAGAGGGGASSAKKTTNKVRVVFDDSAGDEEEGGSGGVTSDYLVCMLQRSAKSSFMANALVFPGGMMEHSDIELAETAAAAAAAEQAKVKVGNTTSSASCCCCSGESGDQLQRLVTAQQATVLAEALQVCAVRETFEECGVCLFPGASKDSFDSPEAAREWRSRVHGDDKQFKELLSATLTQRMDTAANAGPLPGLHRMCRFITPDAEAARGGKGFDASFFLSVLSKDQFEASVAMGCDQKETSSMVWTSPRHALRLHRQGKAFLVRFAA